MEFNKETASQIQINDLVDSTLWNADAGTQKLPNPAMITHIDRCAVSQTGTMLGFKINGGLMHADAGWFALLPTSDLFGGR